VESGNLRVTMRWQYYHTVWFTLLFGWLILYSNRMILSPILVPLMEEFHLTYTEAGFLFAAYFYAYVIMMLPAGFLGDRVGRKKILCIGTVCWSFATFLIGITTTFFQIFFLRVVMGLGQGTYFGNDRPIVSSYTPKEKMGVGQGLSMIGMGVGLALGVALGGILAQTIGWRMTFFVMAVPAFLFSFLVWKFLREPPRIHLVSEKPSYSLAFKSRDILILALVSFLLFYPYWVFATWSPKMFLELGLKELAEASTFASLVGFSCIPGLLISGVMSDRFVGKGFGRKIPAAFFIGITSLFTTLLGYELEIMVSVFVLAVSLFLGMMFLWGIWTFLYAIIADIVPREIYGTVFGFVNSVGFINAIIAPVVAGWIRDVTGSFVWACYLATFLLVIAVVLTLMIRPAFKAKPEIPIKVKKVSKH